MRVFVSYNTRDESAATAVVGGLVAARPDLEIYFAPAANKAGAY